MQTIEDCRAECGIVPDCNFFIWNSPTARNNQLSCWLKKNDNNPRSTWRDVGRISGPVSCNTTTTTATNIHLVDYLPRYLAFLKMGVRLPPNCKFVLLPVFLF